MFSVSKKNIIGFSVLAILLLATFLIGKNYDLQQAKNQAQQQANQLSEYLDTELSRFAAIPHLLTNNHLINELLQGNTAAKDNLNNYLADIQKASGASVLYVINKQGEVIASSNWQSTRTYIGSNFAYRPYFTDALAGKGLAYFALGARSFERGIYISEPLYKHDQVVGVVVLKVNVSKFESDRQLLNTSKTSHFYLTLEDGVMGMSDQASWRLNTFNLLTQSQYNLIAKSRRYLDYKPKKINVTEHQAHDVPIINIPDQMGTHSYVPATATVSHINASMTVLVDISRVNVMQLPRLFWSAVVYIIVLLLSYTFIVRFTGYQKLLYSRRSLELEVIERTQALEKAQKALIQSAKLATIGQLSAGINHEINQPLSAMSTYLVSAKRLIAKGDIEQAAENIIIVQSLIERVHQIVGQLRHFSKPSQAELGQRSLSQMLRNALMIASAQLKRDGITVTKLNISDHIMVWVDSIKFEQVLVNLITNASQAMGESDNRELSFCVDEFENRVKLSILDTGSGIEQHAFQSIFEPFYSTKSKNGLGLGLSISKQIINSFNGCLSAHNRPEGGAEFIITLSAKKECYVSH